MTDSASYLDQLASSQPELSPALSELKDYQSKRLWHQLSLKLTELSTHAYFQHSPNFLTLYQSFITPVASKLNPLSFATYTVAGSQQLPSAEESLKFLESNDKLVSDDKQAKLTLSLAKTSSQLRLGQIDAGKRALQDAKVALDSYEGVMDTSIYALFYRVKCELAKIEKDYAAFYHNALLYLTYTPLTSISEADRLSLAIELGIAALAGKTIYNFGELLQHPILQSLETNSQYQWLSQFLLTFNSGNMQEFNRLLIKAAEKAGESLQSNLAFLQQKIRVMALIDLAFQRPTNNRVFAFREIASACEIEVNEVEWLVMKALALKVIKGKINECQQEVRISWVQARALSKDQLVVLKDRIHDWVDRVQHATNYIEENARQIINTGIRV